jgi:hypothetical protein
MSLAGICIVAWLASAIAHALVWWPLRPVAWSGYPIHVAVALWWLGCGLAIYAGLAWARLGGAFLGAHVVLLAVLSLVYLDHIACLSESYAEGPRHWSSLLPPVTGALAMALVVVSGWALWYRGQPRTGQFSVRLLMAATAVTAVLLAGLSALEGRERDRLEQRYRGREVQRLLSEPPTE